MQLYRIANGIKNCFKVDENAVVNGETGEVFDADYLDQLKMKKEAKVDNIACWIKELEAEAAPKLATTGHVRCSPMSRLCSISKGVRKTAHSWNRYEKNLGGNNGVHKL